MYKKIINYFNSQINFKEYSEKVGELNFTILSILFAYFIWCYGQITDVSVSISSVLNKSYLCPVYFQNCEFLHFMEPLPYGYSQMVFFAFVLCIFIYAIHNLFKKQYTEVYFSILALFTLKVYYLFAGKTLANYDYYDLVFAFVFLFLPFRPFFMRLSLVILYFLAATIKIHPGWFAGTYFSSLQLGLPIFGNGNFAILVTQFVLIMQILGAWFLFSKNFWLQRLSFCYFFAFHIFSSLLVAWRYPVSILFMLCTLFFWHLDKNIRVPSFREGIIGYLFIFTLFCLQFVAIMIPGDQKLTLEGNYLGLYMFEANHQCKIKFVLYDKDNKQIAEYNQSSDSARFRCDPYRYWFKATRDYCERENVARVQLTEDHSINGSHFYRIVDSENICKESYFVLKHNNWILDETKAEKVGVPLKNFYY